FGNASVQEDQDALYLRSDDYQRTVMSGQILTASMFNMSRVTILPWHTGDVVMDPISTKESACPRLKDLKDEARHSKEYKDRLESAETKEFVQRAEKVWGSERKHIIDCLMTTACTGKSLPEGQK
ncbi:unnamed protein product, partial [Choristocarpus tenellus]